MVQSGRLLGISDPLVTATDMNGGIPSTVTLTKHRTESISGKKKYFDSNDVLYFQYWAIIKY